MTGINMTAVIICGLICFTLIVLCAIPNRKHAETLPDKSEPHREPQRASQGMPDAMTVNMLNKTCLAYERELKARMSPDEFDEMSDRIAKELFADEVLNMPDGAFKETIMNCFDQITGSEQDFNSLFGDDEEDDT